MMLSQPANVRAVRLAAAAAVVTLQRSVGVKLILIV